MVTKKIQRRPRKFKLVKSTPAQIAKRNRDFERMTPEQKRVAVAKDALAMLVSKRLVARPGIYLHVMPDLEPNSLPMRWFDMPQETQVCDIIAGAPSCEVCGIGAIFASSVLRFNKLELGGPVSGLGRAALECGHTPMREYLGQMGIFSGDQLKSIESAFERYTENPESSPWKNTKAGKMYLHIDSPKDRLIAILKNIIRNNGTFVVEKVKR